MENNTVKIIEVMNGYERLLITYRSQFSLYYDNQIKIQIHQGYRSNKSDSDDRENLIHKMISDLDLSTRFVAILIEGGRSEENNYYENINFFSLNIFYHAIKEQLKILDNLDDLSKTLKEYKAILHAGCIMMKNRLGELVNIDFSKYTNPESIVKSIFNEAKNGNGFMLFEARSILEFELQFNDVQGELREKITTKSFELFNKSLDLADERALLVLKQFAKQKEELDKRVNNLFD
ncbi:hypothetical protein [Breznakia pachnodae]|uniref:Uncharacterized protein n=1 Tax=Breznakia pachnodae TaxID=265178 RepID=A0ABU0DYD7_9FIRM|nr:hypothetical protein [Breznakia pachnodae]MDQ0359451.1 hypothetical protein [Breznakia pachnodae]